jgi:hypothetical protein
VRLDAAPPPRLRRCWSRELAASLPAQHGATFIEDVGTDAVCYELRTADETLVRLPRPASTAGAARRVIVLLGSLARRCSSSGSAAPSRSRRSRRCAYRD